MMHSNSTTRMILSHVLIGLTVTLMILVNTAALAGRKGGARGGGGRFSGGSPGEKAAREEAVGDFQVVAAEDRPV